MRVGPRLLAQCFGIYWPNGQSWDSRTSLLKVLPSDLCESAWWRVRRLFCGLKRSLERGWQLERSCAPYKRENVPPAPPPVFAPVVRQCYHRSARAHQRPNHPPLASQLPADLAWFPKGCPGVFLHLSSAAMDQKEWSFY